MVPRVGVEPTRLSSMDFESIASTNFTTRALHDLSYRILVKKSIKYFIIYQPRDEPPPPVLPPPPRLNEPPPLLPPNVDISNILKRIFKIKPFK